MREETYATLAWANENPFHRQLEAQMCLESLELLGEPAERVTAETNRFKKGLLEQVIKEYGEDQARRYLGQQKFDAIRALT